MSEIYDVIVSGAGPAGAFLALQLSKIGMKVLVLDKNLTSKRKICGEYLCPKGVELLEEQGLDEWILGSFAPLYGMTVFTSTGRKVPTYFPKGHKGRSIKRDVFDGKLVELAKASGAIFSFGETLRSLSRRVDLWQIKTDKGEYLTRSLVGADGRASFVSKALGNDKIVESKRVALHVYAKSMKATDRQGEMHLFEDGSYIGLNPIDEAEVNISLVTDASSVQGLGGPLKALNHYLSQSLELKSRFSLFTETDRISSAFPITHSTKSIVPGQKVALVGDAAGFIDPLTGEGLYNALFSASLLAKEFTKNRKERLCLNQSLFNNYQVQYQYHLRHKQILNRLFQLLIRKPKLVDWVALYLQTRQTRADAFIAIIGNIYSPLKGLAKIIL